MQRSDVQFLDNAQFKHFNDLLMKGNEFGKFQAQQVKRLITQTVISTSNDKKLNSNGKKIRKNHLSIWFLKVHE